MVFMFIRLLNLITLLISITDSYIYIIRIRVSRCDPDHMTFPTYSDPFIRR